MQLKKILAAVCLSALSAAPSAYAVNTPLPADNGGGGSPSASSPSPAAEKKPVQVRVSEKVPGAKCVDAVPFNKDAPVYVCDVGEGFSGFFDALRGLLKYGMFIGLLFGVLMLVVAGIRYSAAGMLGDEEKGNAKAMLVKVISGIVGLALIGFLLNTFAPWVFGS